MTFRRPVTSAALIPLAVALLTACSDSTGSGTPRIAALAVSGVQMDAAAFQSSGVFGLGLLAKDASGKAILSTGVRVDVALTEVTGAAPAASFALAVQGTSSQSPKNAPTDAAVLLDDSGSMSSSDPSRQRAAAAQLFWEAVLPARSTNRVALLDFGAGSTTGFISTRLLHTWTRDEQALQDRLTMIVNSGGTPLYRSLQETAQWMDSTTAGNANRVLLLLSDGQPGDASLRVSAIAAAQAAGLTVHTVGLGSASDLVAFPNANAIATVREIAEQTGGVYAAATQADALAAIFQTLANVASLGQLIASLQIVPTPATGALVSGTVTVTSGGGSETAIWSFRAP